MSKVLSTILIVRPESNLEKAIAKDLEVNDDKDLDNSFLLNMSTDYNKQNKNRTLVEENMGTL